MSTLSPLRARLASFSHAYAVALRLRERGHEHLLILRTGSPLQPYRIAGANPEPREDVLALIA